MGLIPGNAKNSITSFPEKKFFFNNKKILRHGGSPSGILSIFLQHVAKTLHRSQKTESEMHTNTVLTPTLSEGVDYTSETSNNEIISTTNTILTTIGPLRTIILLTKIKLILLPKQMCLTLQKYLVLS